LRFPVTTFKGWDWPESVASHGFRRGYSQFRERNRNAHVAIRGLESQ
jgi:hypothetical protein